MNAICELIAIIQKLRHPHTGCPWHLQQDYHSLIKYSREELGEIVTAIANNDKENLCEELGDLLFHLVYYSQLAQEEGAFSFKDVLTRLNEKLIRRHPHIFARPKGQETTNLSIEEISHMWQKIKDEEKAAKLKKNK